MIKKIIIKKIKDKEKSFIAYHKNNFLKSTFYISFNDTILGAVAINDFYKMLKSKYSNDTFNFVISKNDINFQNKHLLNQINENREVVKL